jgi:GTPase SAR1 family protein
VRRDWKAELRYHCPDTPILLVGLKCDVRAEADDSEHIVEEPEGLAVARECGAIGYEECSSLQDINVKGVFISAVEHLTGVRKPLGAERRCSVQ